MFRNRRKKRELADAVLEELASHALTLSHARHISAAGARKIGLRVTLLEDDQDLQDAVMSVHHATVQTLQDTPAIKIVENQEGVAFIQGMRPARS